LPEWIEQVSSRSITSSGGRGSGKRTFFASGYATTRAVFLSMNGTTADIAGTVVPTKGSRHPEFSGLIARDFTITPVEGHTDLWKVDWSYEMVSTSYTSAPPIEPIEVLPNEVNYVELSSEIRAEFAPSFRKNVTLPDKGIPGEPDFGDPDDPDNDIAGDPVDAGGNPTSVIRRIQELVLTETVNVPDFGTYGLFRFTRNAAAFLGAAPGRVLYRGASVRRTGVNVFVVSHSFVDDSEFHLQQQALLDQDGRAVLNDQKKADKVYHIQPFPTLLNFDGISPNVANFKI
jgi:hypothetical protein